MLILALESSAKPASVAICSDTELLGQYYQNSGLTHSRTLLAMAESLLKNLGISVADVGLTAVSRGPGSFTGVRIGVSAAKGFAWSLGKPLCGVSTLEAMAYQAPEPGVILCPVMDARRSQVYNALFEWQGEKLIRLCDDRAISLVDLSTELRSRCIRPAPKLNNSGSTTPCLLLGDGAKICHDYLNTEGVPSRIAPELIRWQTAYGVALAALHTEPVPAADLEPSYLRPSQAERERGMSEGLS